MDHGASFDTPETLKNGFQETVCQQCKELERNTYFMFFQSQFLQAFKDVLEISDTIEAQLITLLLFHTTL